MALLTEDEVLARCSRNLTEVLTTQDVQTQLAKLAEVKEDLLYRTGLMRDVGRTKEAEDIAEPLLELMTTSKSPKVRKWAVGFATELTELSPLWVSSFTLLGALQVALGDSKPGVLREAIKAATKVHTSALKLLASVGDDVPEAERAAAERLTPQHFAEISTIIKTVLKLGAARDQTDAGVRIRSLKLYETVALSNAELLAAPADRVEEACAVMGKSRLEVSRGSMNLVESLLEMLAPAKPMVFGVIVKLVLSLGLKMEAVRGPVIEKLVELAHGLPKQLKGKSNVLFDLRSALVAFLKLPATENWHKVLYDALRDKELDADEHAQQAIRVAEHAMRRLSGFRQALRDAMDAEIQEMQKRQKTLNLTAELTSSLESLVEVDKSAAGIIRDALAEAGGDLAKLVDILTDSGLDLSSLQGKLAGLVSASSKGGEGGAQDASRSDPRRAGAKLPWSARLAAAAKEAPAPASLTLQQCLGLYDAAVSRATKKVNAVRAGGGSHVLFSLLPHLGLLRMLILAQKETGTLVSSGAGGSSYAEATLLAFLVESLPDSVPTILGWLHLAYANVHGLMDMELLPESAYEDLLGAVVGAILKAEGSKTEHVRSLSEILINAPQVPKGIVDVVREFTLREVETGAMEIEGEEGSGSSVGAGLELWRDMALMRPTGAPEFLDVILCATQTEKREAREQAVAIVVGELFVRADLREQIEGFARTGLESLCKLTDGDGPGADADEAEKEAIENSVTARLALYMGLVSSAPDLLEGIMELYPSFAKHVKRAVNKEVKPIVLELGATAPAVLRVVETHTEEAGLFVLQILHALSDTSIPPRELVDVVLRVYKERMQNPRLLIPVLGGMAREDLEVHLPSLLELQEKTTRYVVQKILRTQGMAMEPTQFVVYLHGLDGVSDGFAARLDQIVTWVFEADKAIPSQKLPRLVTDLVRLDRVSGLMMTTFTKALKAYPSLARFIIDNLAKVIARSKETKDPKKKLWRDGGAWTAFGEFVLLARPTSLQLAFQLPTKAFGALIQRHEELVGDLTEYGKAMGVKRGAYGAQLEELKKRRKKMRRRAKKAAAAAAAAAAEGGTSAMDVESTGGAGK